MTKRATITHGIRHMRYVVAGVGILVLGYAIQHSDLKAFILSLASGPLFYVFYKARRISFDDEHIYRIYGKTEKTIPFLHIISIKRTPHKTNGVRMWRVTYFNDGKKQRSFLFKEGLFQLGSANQFIKAVKKVNPSVVIWSHRFFNFPY